MRDGMKLQALLPFLLLGWFGRILAWSILPRTTLSTHHCGTNKAVGRPWSTHHVLLANNNDNNNNNNENVAAADDHAARLLLEKAEKARQEADKMERDLVSTQLSKLENLLERQSQFPKADVQDIQDRIDRLKNYNQNNINTTTTTAVPQEAEVEQNSSNNGEQAEEVPEEREIVKDLTPEDKEVLEQFQRIFSDVRDVFLDAEVDMKEVKELEDEMTMLLSGDNITQEELETLKDLQEIGNSVIEFFGLNQSVWGEALQQTKEITAELSKDPLYIERLESLERVVPPQIMKATSEDRLNETDMYEFVQIVMLPLKDVFSLSNINAKRVGGAYLVQGVPKIESGDEIVERIDKQLAETGLQNKFQFYYIKDSTTVIDMDEVQMADEVGLGEAELETAFENLGNLAKPALLVTSSKVGSNIGPQQPPEARAAWSLLAVLATAAFAVDCYQLDMGGVGIMEEFQLGLTSPIFLGILGIQLVHEVGHFAAATLNKIEVSYPFTAIPNPSTGLLQTNTELNSSPKNNNALFDFAIMGPILGMSASWSSLLLGLQMTAKVKTSEIGSLPHLPLEFFQLSTLTSSTIETFLGTDVLLSLDPVSDNVAVHPLVVAGHVGILLNALNLLPTMSTTDGGRMLIAVDTRAGILAEALPPLFGLFLWIQGFRGWDTCNLLILYALVTGISQHKVEVPCRNDVDQAGGLRGLALVATTALALIALSPAF